MSDFRSYARLDLRLSGDMAALHGENGAGKTNLLEALSLFSPGRGLRRAEIASCARRDAGGGFAVSAEVEANGETLQLGHGFDPEAGRRFRLDRAPVGSASAFAEHLRIVWLTPAMDGLFSGPAAERRRFLDRLALGVDPGHGARSNRLERALRNRNRLLEERAGDKRWLDAAEQEVASLGVAVAAARVETVDRLSALIEATRDAASAFPYARLELQGDVETLLRSAPALDVEDQYRALLMDNRRKDAAAGRTLIGPHGSDLVVRHGPKDEIARDCSTGEQKALLAGLILAHARLIEAMTAIAPLLLMDEVAAHFDARRREALYRELAAIGGQTFMTGADPSLFEALGEQAQSIRVTPGRAEPLR